MCKNVFYEQLITMRSDDLHTLLKKSCEITTYNNLMLNLAHPIKGINVILHNNNVNIITNHK
ncbi:MAG: hypothetical protein AB8U25_04235 [Rickettsiales endosymbiont of Dermacentor nuttalli]